MINNFRVDVFFRGRHYITEFAEFWLAKVFADAIKNDEDVSCVYILERVASTGNFDVTRKIK